MDYKDINVDFVERTIRNQECIDQSTIKLPYEVTHLLNQCYGLLIFPQQKLDETIKNMSKNLSNYGIKNENIVFHTKRHSKNPLEDVVRSMRNGLAHGNIKTQSDGKSKMIERIIIQNINPNNKQLIVTVTLTIEELRTFVNNFSKEYLKWMSKENDAEPEEPKACPSETDTKPSIF